MGHRRSLFDRRRWDLNRTAVVGFARQVASLRRSRSRVQSVFTVAFASAAGVVGAIGGLRHGLLINYSMANHNVRATIEHRLPALTSNQDEMSDGRADAAGALGQSGHRNGRRLPLTGDGVHAFGWRGFTGRVLDKGPVGLFSRSRKSEPATPPPSPAARLSGQKDLATAHPVMAGLHRPTRNDSELRPGGVRDLPGRRRPADPEAALMGPCASATPG